MTSRLPEESGGQGAGKPAGGTFGVDAPYVPVTLGASALVLAGLALVFSVTRGPASGVVAWVVAAALGVSTISYLYTTLHGKFAWWADLLDDARLLGDEHAVDLGCGRGAVLINLAKRMTTGRVSGIDLWRSRHQSGNDIEATKRNARACGVEDRVELNTGDITALPYDDRQFDLVVSSLVLHTVKPRSARRQAVREAVRVLEPGGKLIFADISHTDDYAAWLAEAGMQNVELRDFGVRGWWGGPWITTRAVTALKAPDPITPWTEPAGLR